MFFSCFKLAGLMHYCCSDELIWHPADGLGLELGLHAYTEIPEFSLNVQFKKNWDSSIFRIVIHKVVDTNQIQKLCFSHNTGCLQVKKRKTIYGAQGAAARSWIA